MTGSRWVSHLDSAGIERSPIVSGFIGQLIEFRTPDGLCIRIYTNATGSLDDLEMRPEQVDFENSQLGSAIISP